jgi:hypothetical protein
MAMSSGSASGRFGGRADAVGLGELIRDLRLAHGWSQGRLVAALEAAWGVRLGREYVSRWEHGSGVRANSGCGTWPQCCRSR